MKSTDNCAQNTLGFLQWKYKQTKKLFQKLTQELKVNLLVMNRGLPDYARGLCEEFGLAVIEYAPLDEVKDLALEANILGKAIYPYYYTNSNATCTFVSLEQNGPSGQ